MATRKETYQVAQEYLDAKTSLQDAEEALSKAHAGPLKDLAEELLALPDAIRLMEAAKDAVLMLDLEAS